MKTRIICVAILLCLILNNSINTVSAPLMDTNLYYLYDDSESQKEPQRNDQADTNRIANWPTGPRLNCKAAILLEANTGVILYAKNIHSRLYPASTTKIMTALLAAENSEMSDMVTFSHDAVFSLEAGSSNIGIDPGQSLSMEECLYGLMVGSANEVANAIAEYVGGSNKGFVDMMNDRVSKLGLHNTHFVNPNGLHDEDHYTSAYDLAIIARELFNNEKLSKIINTPSYHFKPTSTQPDDFYLRNKHKLINGDIPYAGVKGGKTGYTSESNETLVTEAEQNGMRLICVVMYEDSPEQFNDTVKLFDYGFNNFAVVNIAENENRYSVKSSNFFPTTIDILGSSKQILELNKDSYIIMPKNLTFDDLETKLDYDTSEEDTIAFIQYSYHKAYLGYGSVKKKDNLMVTSAFDPELTTKEELTVNQEDDTIYINIVNIAFIVVMGALGLIMLSYIISILFNYNIMDNMKEKKNNRRRIRRDRSKIRF